MEMKFDTATDVFCAALEIKEKKKSLYEDAMKKCPDRVGKETFGMLKAAEEDHLKRIHEIYEKFKQGKASAETCLFHGFESADKMAFLRKVAEESGRLPKACLDDVAAIEVGLGLENSAMEFFSNRLGESKDPVEVEFLKAMIAEEREHHRLLADLKFYYVDTENWFLEKGRQRLDGAGAGA